MDKNDSEEYSNVAYINKGVAERKLKDDEPNNG